MPQDLLFECLQLRSRVEAEFVAQMLLDPAVGGERVALSTCSVERGDQQPP